MQSNDFRWDAQGSGLRAQGIECRCNDPRQPDRVVKTKTPDDCAPGVCYFVRQVSQPCDQPYLPIFAKHGAGFDRQFHGGQTQRFARHIFADPIDFKHDTARFYLGSPEINGTFTFTHPNLGWF